VPKDQPIIIIDLNLFIVFLKIINCPLIPKLWWLKKNQFIMKQEKKITKKLAAVAASALAISAVCVSANSIDLFETSDLGTAGELRVQLLGDIVPTGFMNNADVELKCGEGKCGEGKCGEGKCGEGKDKAEKKDDKKSDDKSEVKPETKEDKKAEKKSEAKEDKGTEAKCGEGKCGEGKCGEH
jgi:uncharacterized low-complexity protein|tara:strand:+ start:300 stop:848 length:549 start_codon:yes stop_codon:yes gene_type:complete